MHPLPAPPFADFIADVCSKHGIDPLFPGARLVMEQEGRGTLLIECVAPSRLLIAQRYEDERDIILTPVAIVYTGTTAWIPIGLQSDPGHLLAAEISEDGRRLEDLKAILQERVASICIDWGLALLDGGWIENGVVVAKDRGDEAHAATGIGDLLRGLGIEAGVSR